MIGKTDADLLSSEDAAKMTALKQRVLDTGIGIRQRLTTGGGAHTRIFDLTVEPLKNPGGEIVGITSATIDITERKKE